MLNVKRLDERLDEYAEGFKLLGSLRLTVKGEIIYEKFFGYEVVEKGKPIDRNSLFTFYSMSKPFCAMGLLKLVDKGLVDMNAHPSKYLPEASKLHPGITLANMMRHISGLPSFKPSMMTDEARGESSASGQLFCMLKNLHKEKMVVEPETAHEYTNVNFNIPALIIERISGFEYSEYMKKEVFDPLGAVNARVADEFHPVTESNAVKGYELDSKGAFVPVKRDTFATLGAGDMVGTVDDAYTLNLAVKNKLLLKEDTWREALTSSKFSRLAWCGRVNDWHDRVRIMHHGGSLGFRTIHNYLPDDFDLILLSNSGWGDARHDVSEIVYEEYYGVPQSKAEKVKMDGKYIKQV